MAFTVNFYNFAKRDNSTAIPTAASIANTFQCNLKDGTSILDPVLVLEYSGLPAWSYFDFGGRYYKVTDIRSIRQSLIEVSGTVDVLASWKSAIQATSAFVLYDTAANTEITDTRLSIKTTPTVNISSGGGWDYLGGGTCIILNVIGAEGENGNQNGVGSYAVSVDNGRQIMRLINDYAANILPDVDTPPTDVVESLVLLYDLLKDRGRQAIKMPAALDCIKSAIIFPCDYTRVYGFSASELWLGEYRVALSCKRALMGAYDHQTVTIPWQSTDWRRNAPYTEVLLYLPYHGVVNIPVGDLIGATSITAEYGFTYADGGCCVKVYRGGYDPLTPSSNILYKGSCALGGSYGIGNAQTSGFMVGSSFIGGAAAVGAAAAATILTGGSALPIVGAGAAGIAGVFNSLTQTPSSVGSSGGGLLESSPNVQCMVIYHDTIVAPDSVSAAIGTPSMAVKSLGSLSGYVQTRAASVSGAMTDRERNAINRYLDGGIYIE